jgi:hypothetical protein
MKSSVAQFGYDPIEFMKKCQRQEIPDSEFARVGPAMAINYLIVQQKESEG